MRDEQELKNILKETLNIDDIIIPAIVKSVDETEFICKAEDINGNTIFDVRLRATIDSEEKSNFCLIPKVGSSILIAKIGNEGNYYSVINVSEVDKVVNTINENTVIIDNDGININVVNGNITINETQLDVSKENGIVIDKGGNGGLTITPKLVEELEKLSARVDSIYDGFSKLILDPPQAGSASVTNGLKAIISGTKENFGEIENKKVKH